MGSNNIFGQFSQEAIIFRTLVLWCVVKDYLVVILGGMEFDFGSKVMRNNVWFQIISFLAF